MESQGQLNYKYVWNEWNDDRSGKNNAINTWLNKNWNNSFCVIDIYVHIIIWTMFNEFGTVPDQLAQFAYSNLMLKFHTYHKW